MGVAKKSAGGAIWKRYATWGTGLDFVILLSQGGWVLIMVLYGGGRGECQKNDVICERPLTIVFSSIVYYSKKI